MYTGSVLSNLSTMLPPAWNNPLQEEAENLEARLAAMLTALKTAQEAAEQEAVGGGARGIEQRGLHRHLLKIYVSMCPWAVK